MSNWWKRLLGFESEDDDLDDVGHYERHRPMAKGRIEAPGKNVEVRMLRQYPSDAQQQNTAEKNRQHKAALERESDPYDEPAYTRSRYAAHQGLNKHKSTYQENSSKVRETGTKEKQENKSYPKTRFKPTEIPSPIYGYRKRPKNMSETKDSQQIWATHQPPEDRQSDLRPRSTSQRHQEQDAFFHSRHEKRVNHHALSSKVDTDAKPTTLLSHALDKQGSAKRFRSETQQQVSDEMSVPVSELAHTEAHSGAQVPLIQEEVGDEENNVTFSSHIAPADHLATDSKADGTSNSREDIEPVEDRQTGETGKKDDLSEQKYAVTAEKKEEYAPVVEVEAVDQEERESEEVELDRAVPEPVLETEGEYFPVTEVEADDQEERESEEIELDRAVPEPVLETEGEYFPITEVEAVDQEERESEEVELDGAVPEPVLETEGEYFPVTEVEADDQEENESATERLGNAEIGAAAEVETEEVHQERAGVFVHEVLETENVQQQENSLSNQTTENGDESRGQEGRERRHSSIPFNVLMFGADRISARKKKPLDHSEPSERSEPVKRQGTESTKPSSSLTLDLLNDPPESLEDDSQWIHEKQMILEETLLNFHVKAEIVGHVQGPAVTRFELKLHPGVKINKILNLTEDIKLSMAAKQIRIAPVPGKSIVGIEIPNGGRKPVFLKQLLQSEHYLNSHSPLTATLGMDVSGQQVVTDLAKMPHGLIAGATGSGKSVCIHSLLLSLIYKTSPEDLRMILIDPKVVELAAYQQLPHLAAPLITQPKEAALALKWAVAEMEERYQRFAKKGVRDIQRYNRAIQETAEEKMPYIVIVIDELADLMMASPQDVEEAICRIAQKARAAGIHMLLATQRPSVDVITGLIKSNIPTRIAFSVSSQADSRTILDAGGAERLLGQGDMLFVENGARDMKRLQGAFVTDEEIDRVTEALKHVEPMPFLFDIEQIQERRMDVESEEDDLFEEAAMFVIEQGQASVSSLQRRFRIGYNRAARLVDQLEAGAIISEANGSKPRQVLVNKDTFSESQQNKALNSDWV
ncbi:DNA translocase SftA [Pullulanibacillus camelliae]|uniref:DNA translocase SftA n=1 Tax=Pullulanibacillus camelliae TaxID=1707096 RepID=A0A8J2YNI8_9BACL|nr:DNA translocase FtsK [Pullulanibacillus camelliae]GGE55273.1 DNA translocase SftA [Pullulanibacillus camelliae]